MSAELKPCPFCRSKLTEEIPGSGWYTHTDFDCVLSGFQVDITGKFNQASAWNRRAQPAEEDKLRYALQFAIDNLEIANRYMDFGDVLTELKTTLDKP